MFILVDNVLGFTVLSLCSNSMMVIGTVVVIGYSTPIFLIIVVPIGILYYFIQVIEWAALVSLFLLTLLLFNTYRFSISDNVLGSNVFSSTRNFINLTGTAIVISYSVPVFMVFVVPLLLQFVFFQV